MAGSETCLFLNQIRITKNEQPFNIIQYELSLTGFTAGIRIFLWILFSTSMGFCSIALFRILISVQLLIELPDAPAVIREPVVVNPSTHNPDYRVQGLPSVGVELLPQKASQAFQFSSEAILPTGKLQPPVSLSRSSPVAGEPQKVERRETFSSLICPHSRHVTCSKKLRFVFV